MSIFYKDMLIDPGKSKLKVEQHKNLDTKKHMKNIKGLIASIAILGVVGLAVGTGAGAADVVATVTPQVVSVTVADGTVDYGILPVNGGTNNTFDGLATADTQIITSASNVSTDVLLRSSDAAKFGAAGVTDWDLVATAAADDFVHSFDINASGTAVFVAFPADGTFANTNTTSVVTLANNGDTATLDLKIDMPTSATDTSIHSIDVTVIATAS